MMRCMFRALVTSLAVALAGGAAFADGPKTLRVAFPIAATNFDPAQISDLYSNTVMAGIFEAPLEYEFLAQPARLRLNTAAAMPEVSEDFRTFTVRIKPGIYFADDPAFQGTKRELVAADYVYAIKRFYDPRWRSPRLGQLETSGLIGLAELRQQALQGNRPFDYDVEVEGVRALDRYTLQINLDKPDPRFVYTFAFGSFIGAVAREVVEFYGDRVGDHPVGTGPFRLAAWQRGSRILLERNPTFREVFYDEHPAEDDSARRATAARLAGRRLPMVDRVQISIIQETQPRWLSFLNGQLDVSEVPPAFISIAVPNNALAPHLEKRGIQMDRYPRTDVSVTYFAMDNPVVGGYEPHKVALRRAISLAVDVGREIRLARHDQAIPAQSLIAPGAWGYAAAFKSEMSDYDLPRAKALLDLYGYVDRDGDGWRDQPDGQPLLLEYATQPDQASRSLDALWKKNMDDLGVRLQFKVATWPENLKASRAGQLMVWGVGWSIGVPDADGFLVLGYGKAEGSNRSRFALPEYDELYEAQARLADGPERQALIDRAKLLLIAYMPYKVHVHRITTELMHPWVVGNHGAHFRGLFWKYVDIDMAEQGRHAP